MQPDSPLTQRQIVNGWITGAALIVILAGIRAASDLISSLLMAAFIAIICYAPIAKLQQRGMPRLLVLIVVLGVLVLVGSILFNLTSASINSFNESLPYYQSRLPVLYDEATAWISAIGVNPEWFSFDQILQPGRIGAWFNLLLTALRELLADSLIVLILVLFILAEAAQLPRKLNEALASPEESLAPLRTFIQKMVHYLALKAATSLATALCVALLLWFFDINHLPLWAMLAFFLNFIPYIGSIMAGLPPVLLALLDHGLFTALWIGGGYLGINSVIGNFLEPRWLGRGLDLSSFVVLLSLLFWGWMLGPIGMFLSVPLTMLILIALEINPHSRWIAHLMRR